MGEDGDNVASGVGVVVGWNVMASLKSEYWVLKFSRSGLGTSEEVEVCFFKYRLPK
jgi:hypothetical protein